MRTSYETMQCNGKLYNVHDILSWFCDFDFDSIFFEKHRLIDRPFERGDNSCNLILSFANLSRNSFRVYVLFYLVTWPFWSDDNGAVWCLINPLKSQGLSPLFFLLKKHRRVRTFDLPLCSLEAHARCPSLPQCKALRYQLLSFVMTL